MSELKITKKVYKESGDSEIPTTERTQKVCGGGSHYHHVEKFARSYSEVPTTEQVQISCADSGSFLLRGHNLISDSHRKLIQRLRKKLNKK